MEQDMDKIWEIIFQLADLGDVNKPINPIEIKNPYGNLSKAIIYIYSMQTFLYGTINDASRTQDLSKIDTLGPFAFILS